MASHRYAGQSATGHDGSRVLAPLRCRSSYLGFARHVRLVGQQFEENINYAQWYEYSLSASLMIVLIGMLCGVYDLGALIIAFVLTAVMNFCGLIMEVHNQVTEKTNWTSYVIGCIAGVAPWVAIAIYFFDSLAQA